MRRMPALLSSCIDGHVSVNYSPPFRAARSYRMCDKKHRLHITQYTPPNNSSEDPYPSLRNDSRADEEVIQHGAAFLLASIACSA